MYYINTLYLQKYKSNSNLIYFSNNYNINKINLNTLQLIILKKLLLFYLNDKKKLNLIFKKLLFI